MERFQKFSVDTLNKTIAITSVHSLPVYRFSEHDDELGLWSYAVYVVGCDVSGLRQVVVARSLRPAWVVRHGRRRHIT